MSTLAQNRRLNIRKLIPDVSKRPRVHLDLVGGGTNDRVPLEGGQRVVIGGYFH